MPKIFPSIFNLLYQENEMNTSNIFEGCSTNNFISSMVTVLLSGSQVNILSGQYKYTHKYKVSSINNVYLNTNISKYYTSLHVHTSGYTLANKTLSYNRISMTVNKTLYLVLTRKTSLSKINASFSQVLAS